MSPAKPVGKRIRKPRAKDEGTEPKDFTVLDFGNAAFKISVHDPRELPPPSAPEIAFVGRSNAGKSSAINALANRRRLAFVSKTPGRTQLINFFSLGSRAFLVDLPGYGYAGVPGAVREHWKTLVGEYIDKRSSIALVVIVMDIRHPFTPLDLHLIEWLKTAGRRAHVLLTKSDKLSKQASARALAEGRATLGRVYPGASVQLYSSMKREGLKAAGIALARALDDFGGQKTRAPAKGE